MNKLLSESPPSFKASYQQNWRLALLGLLVLGASLHGALVLGGLSASSVPWGSWLTGRGFVWLGDALWALPVLGFLWGIRLLRLKTRWWRGRLLASLVLPFLLAAFFEARALNGGRGGGEVLRVVEGFLGDGSPMDAGGLAVLTGMGLFLLFFPELLRTLFWLVTRPLLVFTLLRGRRKPDGWTHASLLEGAGEAALPLARPAETAETIDAPAPIEAPVSEAPAARGERRGWFFFRRKKPATLIDAPPLDSPPADAPLPDVEPPESPAFSDNPPSLAPLAPPKEKRGWFFFRRKKPATLIDSALDARAAPTKAKPQRKRALPNALPPLSLFEGRVAKTRPPNAAEIAQRRAELAKTMEDFGIAGEVIGARAGPVITLFEFAPAAGVRASKIVTLSEDIARTMRVISARVAVIPGHHALGIELPNPERQTVPFLPLARLVRQSAARLPLALGVAIDGQPVIADLSTMPHLLVAGTTGSGKSVGVNAMILSLLSKLGPDQCRLIMIDPKMTEFALFQGIPHLLTPVITEAKKAVLALKWAVREMERRYQLLSGAGQRHVETYNQLGEEFLPYIVVLIDEMSDLMLVAGKEIEFAMQRLAQMARAAGIHLITATQRPSVDVITGTIKANFPTRISFQTSSRIDSRTILDTEGAEKLLGQGDMLFMQGAGRISRVHGAYVAETEASKIAEWLRRQLKAAGGEAASGEEITAAPASEAASDDQSGEGGLYANAVAIVLEHKRPTTSFLQRKLQIGYNRAASLIERMEAEGLISPPNHAGKREVLRQ